MPTCEVCGEDVSEAPILEPAYAACWWNALYRLEELERAGRGGGLYVEGWAVRVRNGKRETFEHGWVEIDGQIDDVTPHHHAERYFAGLIFGGDHAMVIRVDIPAYRVLTRAELDGEPNPRYDAASAHSYAAAMEAAEAYCHAANEPADG